MIAAQHCAALCVFCVFSMLFLWNMPKVTTLMQADASQVVHFVTKLPEI